MIQTDQIARPDPKAGAKPIAGPLVALGLMSGTSMDGIDVALLRTDGETVVEPGPTLFQPYSSDMRSALRAILGGGGPVEAVADRLTRAHVEAVRTFLDDNKQLSDSIDVIGMHGHTILHRPGEGRTWQIGDGDILCARTGISVVSDFRGRDVAAGGEGAPFAPLYHAALASDLERPLAVLNMGGVGNVTWIGDRGRILAFDTGPGNALIDDWTQSRTGAPYDRDGALARQGCVDATALSALLDNPYFDMGPPKSLDRDDFDPAPVAALGDADGAATLTAFTAATTARAVAHMPAAPRRWLVTGGGRHNPALMAALSAAFEAPVDPVEAVGWQGDAIEAQAFAFLAVRSLRGLPLSLPGTTGVSEPMTGGRVHRPPADTVARS